MVFLYAYLGGLICIFFMLIAALNNNLTDGNLTFKQVAFVGLMWPLIFPLLSFVKIR